MTYHVMVGHLFYQARTEHTFRLVEEFPDATAFPTKHDARKAARRAGDESVVAVDYGTDAEFFIPGDSGGTAR